MIKKTPYEQAQERVYDRVTRTINENWPYVQQYVATLAGPFDYTHEGYIDWLLANHPTEARRILLALYTAGS